MKSISEYTLEEMMMRNELSDEICLWVKKLSGEGMMPMKEKDIQNTVDELRDSGAEADEIRNAFEAAWNTAVNRGKKRLKKEDILYAYKRHKSSSIKKEPEEIADGNGDNISKREEMEAFPEVDLEQYETSKERAQVMLSVMNAYGSYMIREIDKRKTGICIAETPTGYSKTYTAVEIMALWVTGNLSLSSEPEHMIYITPQNKNLGILKLRNMIIQITGSSELFDAEAIELKSKENNLVECFKGKKTNLLPVSVKTSEEFVRLQEAYHRFSKSPKDEEYRKNLDKAHREFLKYVRKRMDTIIREAKRRDGEDPERIKMIEERKLLIRSNPEFSWMEQWYPQIFVDEKKIIYCNTSKFCCESSNPIGGYGRIYHEPFIKNSVIFMDESDSSKDSMLNVLIDGACTNDFIRLFENLYDALTHQEAKPHKRILEAEDYMRRRRHKKYIPSRRALLSLARTIDEQYHCMEGYSPVGNGSLSSKTVFLRGNDVQCVTSGTQNANYYGYYDPDDHFVSIYYGDVKDLPERLKKAEKIKLPNMLRAIRRFMIQFAEYVSYVAEGYMEHKNMENKKVSAVRRNVEFQDAVSTIMEMLRIEEKDVEVIYNLSPLYTNQKGKKKSGNGWHQGGYYERGIELFEMTTSPTAGERVVFSDLKISTTPEAILAYLASNSLLFMMSATADFPTVYKNFNYNYLKSVLGKKEVFSIRDDKKTYKRMEAELYLKEKAYKKHGINIVIDSDFYSCDDPNRSWEMILSDELKDEETAKAILKRINSSIQVKKSENDGSYNLRRYVNAVLNMWRFLCDDQIMQCLHFEMCTPDDKGNFRENCLVSCMEKLKELYEKRYKSESNAIVKSLLSDDAEKRLQEVKDLMKTGIKVYILTAYASFGAAQNPDFEYISGAFAENVLILDNEPKGRGSKRDIASIYLGEITHRSPSNKSIGKYDKESFTKAVILANELRENGEISYKQEMRRYFQYALYYLGNSHAPDPITIEEDMKLRSINIATLITIVQAVGRFLRAYNKGKKIKISLTPKTLDMINYDEWERHLMTPEGRALCNAARSSANGASYETADEQRIYNYAARRADLDCDAVNYLALYHGASNMERYENVKKSALTYFTLSEEEYQKAGSVMMRDNRMISFGKPVQGYHYAVCGDYKHVLVHTDERALRSMINKENKDQGESSDNPLTWHYKGQVSKKLLRFDALFVYPGMEEHFNETGYFGKDDRAEMYIQSPIIFNNITKGMIGEEAGKFIILKELDLLVHPITDPEIYEKFDGYVELPGGRVYIDFKNYDPDVLVADAGKMAMHAQKKLSEIQNKTGEEDTKVLIVNLFHNEDGNVSRTADKSVVFIGGLLDQEGHILKSNLMELGKELGR